MPAKVVIKEEECIGCGACVSVNDKIFELVEGITKVKVEKIEGDEMIADAKEAADVCPVDIITVTEE